MYCDIIQNEIIFRLQKTTRIKSDEISSLLKLFIFLKKGIKLLSLQFFAEYKLPKHLCGKDGKLGCLSFHYDESACVSSGVKDGYI